MIAASLIRLIMMVFFIYSNDCTLSVEESLEHKACKIFKEKIFFIRPMDDLKTSDDINNPIDALFLNEYYKSINSVAKKFISGEINIYYDGKTYDISKPYIDSIDLIIDIQDSLISKWELNEINELYIDYQKRFAQKKDTIEICDIPGFIKISNIKKPLEYDKRNNYVFKLNKHIKTKEFSYVQIKIRNYLDQGIDVYLVFNNSNGKYVYFFVNDSTFL